jgi:hypothetical protein
VSRLRIAIFCFAALLSLSGRAVAQVGYRPEKSPYRDLEYQREWTFFLGSYDARKDPVGVAPLGGTMLGGRYDAHLTGPLYAGLRLAGAPLRRRVLDPKKPPGERFVGTETVPMLFADVNLSLNLTGFRTWHSLAPYISGGLGVTADLRGAYDVGKYRFGFPVTLNFGAGTKWVPRNHWQLRLDWTNYIYQIRYPDSYFLRTGEFDPVRLPGQAQSLWRRNVALSLGVSFLFRQ